MTMKGSNVTMLIFALALALAGAGLLLIYSSSAVVAAASVNKARGKYRDKAEVVQLVSHHPLYLHKQIVWCLAGFLGLLFFYRWDYNSNARWSKWFWLAAIALVILVLCFARPIKGARRWLIIGPFTLQPSEFAKLALVILTARVLSARAEVLKRFRAGFLPALLLAAATIGAIVVEDFGSAVVIGLVALTMWFIAGVRIRHIVALAPVALLVAALAIWDKPYRWERVEDFFFGREVKTAAWHTTQALIAVGTGGWTGVGLGEGIQKHHFVAEMYTDFVFADVCEELGFVGASLLILTFTALILLGFYVAFKSPDFLGAMLAAGAASMIAIPVIVNVAVVLQCAPTKGLPLPFISYGGSSLLVNLSAIGLLMNIAQRNEETQEIRRSEQSGLFNWLFGRRRVPDWAS
jgi:cell division protein FtsW